MTPKTLKALTVYVFLFSASIQLFAQNHPNVVLIFPDNIGMGEVASFGGVRNVPTPNIDRIGNEGIRLANFNVEYSCTPSRVAILTGRYATRTGEDYFSGITLWENTIAEHLKAAGYATALYGKWDVGGDDWHGKREPTNQGFDEWYGIPGTSHISQFSTMPGFPDSEEKPYIWEGVAGQPARQVKLFDLAARRTIDREAAERSVQFIRKNAAQKKPFFVFYPMTQLHFPALPNPDKANTTGAGDMGDAMADVDYNVGLILRELEKLGIDQNTLVIWCSDNGAELRRPWRGSPGAWRGYYNSAAEGGIRTPCVVRWPGHIPAGQVSNEVVHEMDLFPTIAAAAGIPLLSPSDRIIDGINQWPFLTGKQPESNRESVLYLNRKGELMAVKWHDWKFWYNYKTELPDDGPDNLVRLFDLRVDPTEEIDVKDEYPWVIGIMDAIVKEYEESLVKFPRIPASANAAEPYVPTTVSGNGKITPTYFRTDRMPLPKRTAALPNPDFTGSWSTTELSTVSVINRIDKPNVVTLGSGWGDKISIVQQTDNFKIERIIFTPRELQPTVIYRYALDGSVTENSLNMGRTLPPNKSTAKWEDNRLIIETIMPFQSPENGTWHEAKLTQTLWLQAAKNAPWEPLMVVETTRHGILNGETVTSRTVYSKGYR